MPVSLAGRTLRLVVPLLLLVTAAACSQQDPAADNEPSSSLSSAFASASSSETPSETPTESPTETPTQTPTQSPTPTGPPRTSCLRVTHVGESTSEGLIGPYYLKKRDRLPAQLHRVGVRRVYTDISGARSIIERWHDQPNAQEAVHSRKAKGFDGCWSIAMGTNEAANRAAGSPYGAKARIDLLMHDIGKQPVLWLTVKTLLHSGYYDDAHMQEFNQALIKACDRYPNLRIYDWRSEVKRRWYISDGIHFTSDGYRQRAKRIANALANAYPRGAEPSPTCVVGSTRP